MSVTPEHELRRLREALRVQPDDARLHHALGGVLFALRQPLEALHSYDEALRLRPDCAETCNNRGLALQTLGRHEEALASYSAALRLRPNYPEACYNRANAQAVLGRFAAAEMDYRQAIVQGLQRPEAHNNLALTLAELGRMEEAVGHLRRALDTNPAYTEGWYNLARVLERLGRADEAIRAYDAVLERTPDHVDSRWNCALLRLRRGELQEGWRLYEARFANDARHGHRMRFGERRWTGRESLAGRRILIWSERGYGDMLQFCRYAPLVRDRGAEVTLETQPWLSSLLEGQFPGVRVIAQGDPVPPFDYQCPLLSVPRAYGTELATIPAAPQYLKARPEAAAKWSRRLPAGRLRVGIFWQGNAKAEIGAAHSRSWPLAALEPLTRQKEVQLVSLQVGPGAEQLDAVDFKDRIVRLGDALKAGPDGFIETAAILANLDLLISCDTAIVHLAGALGVPVWVALLGDSEWRWLLGRADSPWYPTMRLFRQRAAGEWSPVVGEMCQALESMHANFHARS